MYSLVLGLGLSGDRPKAIASIYFLLSLMTGIIHYDRLPGLPPERGI
jgi:hypothetical protein